MKSGSDALETVINVLCVRNLDQKVDIYAFNTEKSKSGGK